MIRNSILFNSLALITLIFSCTKQESNKEYSVRSYFPLIQGSVWKYHGTQVEVDTMQFVLGNEYFKLDVSTYDFSPISSGNYRYDGNRSIYLDENLEEEILLDFDSIDNNGWLRKVLSNGEELRGHMTRRDFNFQIDREIFENCLQIEFNSSFTEDLWIKYILAPQVGIVAWESSWINQLNLIEFVKP